MSDGTEGSACPRTVEATHENDCSSSAPGPAGSRWASRRSRRGSAASCSTAATVVSTIERYPLGMTFFSTPEKIEIGGIPFVASHEKPTRRDGLIYYRRVAEHYRARRPARGRGHRRGPPRPDGRFHAHGAAAPRCYQLRRAARSCSPPGTTTSPTCSACPGEDLPHVAHYFVEGHRHWRQDVVIDRGGEQRRRRGARVLAGGRAGDAGPSRRGVGPNGEALGAAGHHQPDQGGEHRGALALRVVRDHPDPVEIESRSDREVELAPGRCGARHDRLPRGHRPCSTAWACRWIDRHRRRRPTTSRR